MARSSRSRTVRSYQSQVSRGRVSPTFSDATDFVDSWSSVPRVVPVTAIPAPFDGLLSPPVSVFDPGPAPVRGPESFDAPQIRQERLGRIVVRPKVDRSIVPVRLAVGLPERVRMCVRRAIRRRVLFARFVAGRRGRSPGPYRRNGFSQFGC